MKLKKLINEDLVYTKVENEIREWVEKTYNGLSVDFYPRVEIVRTGELVCYSEEQTIKICEVVNAKIDEILIAHQEEINLAQNLTKIWKKHPKFNPNISNLEELKTNTKFLKYFKELIIVPKYSKNLAF